MSSGTGGTVALNWALRLLPVLVLAVPIIGTWYLLGERTAVMAGEIEDHSESIDEIEEDIELIQRQLIQRQGEVEIRTQRIEIEQQVQGDKVDQILDILQQIQSGQ